MVRRSWWVIVAVAAACGGAGTNPPVVLEPEWDSPETRALAVKAGCFDCHSNTTVWPWYSSVPLVGASVREHVEEGRAAFNLSRMDQRQEEAHEASEEVAEGEMPPQYYLWMHPTARLTDGERRALVAGLSATFGGEDD